MELILEIAVVIAVSGVLSVGAYVLKLMTLQGAVASFAVGAIVGVFGSLEWFALLMCFTMAGFAVTKIGFGKKKEAGLQEGKHGERTHMNVLGVGVAPCIIAIISFFVDGHGTLMDIMFISTITVAAADTIASELGVKDKDVWLITSFKKVPPGTDGGISVFGTLVSSAGSFAVALLGWVILEQNFDVLFLIPGIAGIVGCMMDSVFGATIETKGYISKYTNNASTALIGAAVAAIMTLPFI